MKKSLEQLIAQYAACPSSKKDYEFEKIKYTVTRHFTEQRDLDKLVYGLAESAADREINL